MSFSIKKNTTPFVTNIYSPSPSVYGSFSSSQSQDLSQNQVKYLVYDTEDISSSGVYCTLPSSDIYVQSTGVYKVLASLQCDKITGGAGTINMYPSINNVAVPSSATKIIINQNLESLMTVEWFLYMQAGQYVRIDIFSIDTGGRALAIAESSPVPAIPSIITTIMKIS